MDTELSKLPSALDQVASAAAGPKFSPGLPIELWSEVVAIVARPITQFAASPSAARRACLQDTYDARNDLLSLAHVCKTTYAAARPYLYGTLVLCLRPSPLHDARIIPEVERVNKGASETAWDVAKTVNHNYLAQREQLSIMSQMFPGSCMLLDDDEDPCSSSHMDRDAKIAQVTEVPEVFPFVVLGGKLYLASLLSHETGTNDSQQSGLDELASVIRTSAESLLVDRGGAEGPSTACLDVKIVNGLVLVSYPLHLVTALDLRTTAIDVGLWLAIPNPNKDYGPIYDWAHKLPFLFDIAPHQLESLVLATWSDCHHAFSDLCEQLFRAFPHVAKLDVLLPNILRYNYPGWFPAHLQSASLFQTGRPWDGNLLPRAFSRNPSRHLEIYGEHPWRYEDWEYLFNHPTLESLVTDFMIPSYTSGALPLSAPRLKSWTTNTLVA